ncbi:unnamed protein product [Boreogadus saida]
MTPQPSLWSSGGAGHRQPAQGQRALLGPPRPEALDLQTSRPPHAQQVPSLTPSREAAQRPWQEALLLHGPWPLLQTGEDPL